MYICHRADAISILIDTEHHTGPEKVSLVEP